MTPLAIKWRGNGPGFMFGGTSRMCIGCLCVYTLLCSGRTALSCAAYYFTRAGPGALVLTTQGQSFGIGASFNAE